MERHVLYAAAPMTASGEAILAKNHIDIDLPAYVPLSRTTARAIRKAAIARATMGTRSMHRFGMD